MLYNMLQSCCDHIKDSFKQRYLLCVHHLLSVRHRCYFFYFTYVPYFFIFTKSVSFLFKIKNLKLKKICAFLDFRNNHRCVYEGRTVPVGIILFVYYVRLDIVKCYFFGKHEQNNFLRLPYCITWGKIKNKNKMRKTSTIKT